MTTTLLIFFAGGLGSLSRYGLDLAVRSITTGGFPYSTSVVNALGCFLFGLVTGLVTHRGALSEEHGLILMVGFLGSFTTFSTFAFEAETMLRQSRWLELCTFVLAQNVLGVLFITLGLRLMR